MTTVDQFESIFNAASKPTHRYEPAPYSRIAVITDLDADAADGLARRLRAAFGTLAQSEWLSIAADRSETVEQLLDLVDRERLDLAVTYRNLHSAAWQWPHSLGRHLDVLTQATECPVLTLPHPRDGSALDSALSRMRVVMAATDHLAGDGRLVNAAVGFVPPGGKLLLAHIEDDAIFERYIDVIGKIPTIDTGNAREALLRQLLKEPHDYVTSCRQALSEAGLDLEVAEFVSTGHRVNVYKQLIDEHSIDLMVLHTKADEQLAMHGLAYPLAVELRHTPLLMI